MKKILIHTVDIRLQAELNDNETAKAVWDALPLTGAANVWGDEIYFTIPLHVEESPEAKQEMEIGALAFWPVGDAFCIFFGPTPVSVNEKPRSYSPVNLFGNITGDATVLRSVSNGDQVHVSRKDE